MTSNFTPKAQNETVSQTNKRSFSQVSANEQATNDNTTNLSFDLNVQNLMPFIEHLKQENQQLKHERDEIQSEMIKLKSVSEGVLQENNLMRQHYQQRTEDIRKIVATMSINMNEEIQDINHMVHMTKNHNFAIVKNIEMAKKEITQKDHDVQQVENQLAELAERNTLLQEEIITRNVKIRQMEEKMEELQHRKLQEDNLFKLEEEVDRLVQQVQVLRQINTKKLKSTQNIQTKNQLEKPHYTAENLNVIQNIKALQQQINQLREDSSAFEKNLENLRTYHKKVSQKCQKANQERQRQTLQIDSQQSEIKVQKQRIYNNKAVHKQREIKKSELEDQKYQLEKELTKRQQKISRMKMEQYREIQNKKTEFKQKSSRQRTQHKLEGEKSYDELKFKLRPEKERKEQALQELKLQHEELEREVEEMKLTIKNMDNPVKEIIRLEYQLKRLNN